MQLDKQARSQVIFWRVLVCFFCFRTITKLLSRHFGRNLKRIGRVSTKSRRNTKLFHYNGFFVLFEERLSLMKYTATFVLCLFRALYKGIDKILDFPKNLYDEKTKAVRVLIKGTHQKDTIVSMEIYLS